MNNKSIKCQACGCEELDQVDIKFVESDLDDLLLDVDFKCCECGNEFNVSASYGKPFITYC